MGHPFMILASKNYYPDLRKIFQTFEPYLDEVFSKVSAKSNLNAKFCFSVEKCEDNEFKLLKSARYAHSKEYIDRLSKRYKFIIESFEETEIRTELGIPLTGYIFILKKI